MKKVTLISDGACIDNPGPGGWAYILRFADHSEERAGGAPDTTNNRMELAAVIEGLKTLTEPFNVLLISDSQYLLNGLLKWRFSWRENEWMRLLRNGEVKPVLNADMWQALDALADKHTVRGQWVKGHSGHPDNERCDELAQAEAEKYVDLPCWTSLISQPIVKKRKSWPPRKSRTRKAAKLVPKSPAPPSTSSATPSSRRSALIHSATPTSRPAFPPSPTATSTFVTTRRSALSSGSPGEWVIAPTSASTTPSPPKKGGNRPTPSGEGPDPPRRK